MKILVTGHRGFIGQNMVNTLRQHHDVITYDRGEYLPVIKGLDWVLHLGAISSTRETDVKKLKEQNVDFSIELLDQCVEYNVNFQFASSASVYGSETVFKESVMAPTNFYAWSKALFEIHALKVAKTATSRIQMFRYFNVYGPNEEHKGDDASPYTKFRIQAEKEGVIRVFEGSEAYARDFVPVQTVVDTHIKFFDVEESGVWNVGSGKATTFIDVAREVSEQYNVPIEIIPFPDNLKGKYQAYTCADLTKLHDSLHKRRI